MNQVKCVPSKMVELSMITPGLFLNLLTASVCPQMDLHLQAQRGLLLGSPVNHRSGLYCVALILGTGTTGTCHQALSWSSATESILSSSHSCPKARRRQGGQGRQLRATWLSVYLLTTFGSLESHARSSQHVEIISAGRGGVLTALNSSLHIAHM